MRNGDGFLVAMLVLLGVVLVVGFFKMLGRGGGGKSTSPHWRPEFGDNGTAERPFKPTISGPGIAIDDRNGWLWIATDLGYKLIDKAAILEWAHEWENVGNNRGGRETWNNTLVFRLTDLQVPIRKVSFGRDFATAEEWKARLTTWLQR